MIGGMTSAVVLTLLVLPAFYCLAKQHTIKHHNKKITADD